MTEREAEQKLDISRARQQSTFCPLINASCRSNCECYYPGEVICSYDPDANEEFSCLEARCTCRLLKWNNRDPYGG